MSGETPVLALEGVSKSFGPVQALRDVNFSIAAGEVVALVGDNGAGKSTLVKAIAGIHSIDDGRLLFEGQPVKVSGPTDAVALGIATVYQDLALCDNLDVVENLFLGREEQSEGIGALTRSLDETSMEQQAHDLLQNLAVTITDVRAEVGTMSGGQRQQVAIARSLLGEPKLVVLDEPTAALGVRQTAQVLALGQAAQGERPRRADDQPQPRGRVRGRGPHLRTAPRCRGGRLPGQRDLAGRDRGGHHRVARPGRRQRQRGRGSGMSAQGAAATVDDVGTPQERPPFLRRVLQGDLGEFRVVIGLIVIWAIFQFQEDRFLTSTNLTNLVLQMTAIGLISVGVVLVLLLGEIDLSVGAVSGLCASIMAVLVVKHGWSPYLGIAAAIAAGAVIGMIQGTIFTRFVVPSFVVTLAGLLAWQGAQLEVLGETGTINITDPKITGLTSTFYDGATGWIITIVGLAAYVAMVLFSRARRARADLPVAPLGSMLLKMGVVVVIALVATWVMQDDRGLPLAALILLGFVLLFQYITTRTRFGRHIFAVGGNDEAARRAGIKVDRVRVAVFMIASSMAAIGGIMAASRLLAVNQSSGASDLLLLAIAGPVVAGTSLFGGRGSVWTALLGALVIQSISNGMDLLALQSSVKFMVTGAVLLLAVVIDALARRQRQAAGRV